MEIGASNLGGARVPKEDSEGRGAMRKSKALGEACVLVLAAGISLNAWAGTLFLEEFEGGLTGWTYTSGVSTGPTIPASDGDSALLTAATDPYYDRLYRPLNVGMGTLTLEFDFLSSLDGPGYEGNVESFAGLYFVNDLSAFIPGEPSTYEDLLGTLVVGSTSANPQNGGTVGSSTIGGDWQHLTISFMNSYTYIVPTFDLGSSDQTTDAFMRFDNVRISGDSVAPVPAPPAVYMAGIGMMACLVLGRMRRRRRVWRCKAKV